MGTKAWVQKQGCGIKRLPTGVKVMTAALAVIYLAFILQDIGAMALGVNSSVLKFISIVLCFFMACIWGTSNTDKTDKALLCTAFFFTVCADACLLLLDQYLLGVVCFCAVQTLYCIRHERARWRSSIILAIAAALMGIILAALGIRAPALYLASAVYGVMLLTSVGRAVGAYRQRRFAYAKSVCICAGLVLFLLCDICVGLYNWLLAMETLPALARAFVVLCWVFYLPSQTLLSLSSIVESDKTV